ncbi:MAG: 4Fe-4S binding protein, partial [Candidatus Competibacteraceae bacterium]|nr:4Fe-4S binding protein [Candidatus Competibacteraceae bacterium]
ARAEPAALVEYRSQGSLLILGPFDTVMTAAQKLKGRLEMTLLISEGEIDFHRLEDEGLDLVQARPRAIEGYLGAFRVTVGGPQGEVDLASLSTTGRERFDLVLDLGHQPLLSWELPPPGYYHAPDVAGLERIVAELPEMVGSFEKPGYVLYDPHICAHGSRGMTGCSRCLEVCPSGALTSIGEMIQLDPFLCQGAGSCAAACPTGAIAYAYPRPRDTLATLQAMLKAYRQAGGERPCLLFYDAQGGRERLERLAGDLPGHMVPFELAELAATGLETWLAALAYGAVGLCWLPAEGLAPSLLRELDRQLELARTLLVGMGYRPPLELLVGDDDDVLQRLHDAPPANPWPPAAFATFDEKRNTLRLAMDHLLAHAPAAEEVVPLPATAPFGRVLVDGGNCTLCMSCAAVCPTGAIATGGGVPRLTFTEEQCVQCGLCERACPERVVTLEARYLYDAKARRRPRVLHEEPPFLCVGCGKPFATRSIIERMTAKLAGHWMYQDQRARRRLQMCEDCRVADMFQAGQNSRTAEGVDKP